VEHSRQKVARVFDYRGRKGEKAVGEKERTTGTDVKSLVTAKQTNSLAKTNLPFT